MRSHGGRELSASSTAGISQGLAAPLAFSVTVCHTVTGGDNSRENRVLDGDGLRLVSCAGQITCLQVDLQCPAIIFFRRSQARGDGDLETREKEDLFETDVGRGGFPTGLRGSACPGTSRIQENGRSLTENEVR